MRSPERLHSGTGVISGKLEQRRDSTELLTPILELLFLDTAAKYNNNTGKLSTSPTGGSSGFYRAKADLPGVVLGTPAVTSTNVQMSVTRP